MAGSDPARYVTTIVAVALVGAGCGTARQTTSTTHSPVTPTRVLAARYMAIARSGNRRLEDAFDPLEERDRNNVTRADADLREAAATERLFDRRLMRIPFGPSTEPAARTLYDVNQVRARLTAAGAKSTSLRELHDYVHELRVANGPVEQAVRAIRRRLSLPPPSSS